jgi:hypothetical protein
MWWCLSLSASRHRLKEGNLRAIRKFAAAVLEPGLAAVDETQHVRPQVTPFVEEVDIQRGVLGEKGVDHLADTRALDVCLPNLAYGWLQ